MTEPIIRDEWVEKAAKAHARWDAPVPEELVDDLWRATEKRPEYLGRMRVALEAVADDIRADALREMGDWFQLASQLGTGERDDIAAQACYDRADRIGGAA